MSTKTCPSCHTEIPQQAYRCKQCFHDFDTKVAPSGSPFMVLLKLVAAMAVVASVVFWQTAGVPSEIQVSVDQRTQTIRVSEMSGGELRTNTIRFSEISQLEHRSLDGGQFVVVVKSHAGTELLFPVKEFSQETFATEVITTINNEGYSVPLVQTGVEDGVQLLTQ